MIAEISPLLKANGIARGGQLYGEWSEQIIANWLNDGEAIEGILLVNASDL